MVVESVSIVGRRGDRIGMSTTVCGVSVIGGGVVGCGVYMGGGWCGVDGCCGV